MSYFLGTLLSYVLLYKYYAIFVIILSGGIIVPWPENTLLFASGAFASQGYISFWAVFITALVANVLGDLIDYGLTYWWGYKVIKEHHIKKYWYVEKLNIYLRNHAGMTVFLTRFVGTVGPIVNFLSGLAGIPFKKFLAFDILGNAFDIGIFLCIGYALGNVWQNFSSITDTLGWILSGVAVLSIAVRIFWKKPSLPAADRQIEQK